MGEKSLKYCDILSKDKRGIFTCDLLRDNSSAGYFNRAACVDLSEHNDIVSLSPLCCRSPNTKHNRLKSTLDKVD